MDLVERLLNGDRRALARLATHAENGSDLGEAALRLIYPRTGRAHVVGITGPPGAGKSTLVNALIGAFRQRGRRIGVVAVDPSSASTGGATLGDRLRMMEWHADDAVFVRSMATRGHWGGIGQATAGVVHLLDAAGFDPVLVETVGVGQAEVAIADHAHTTVLVQVPGLGDAVQSLKAGLVEHADILVVNKADREGADQLGRDLREMVRLGTRDEHDWTPTVIATTATTGHGVDALADVLEAHRAFLQHGMGWNERTRAMAGSEVSSYLRAEVDRRLSDRQASRSALDQGIDAVAQRRITPREAASSLVADLCLE